jgi:hypothetical protein
VRNRRRTSILEFRCVSLIEYAGCVQVKPVSGGLDAVGRRKGKHRGEVLCSPHVDVLGVHAMTA